MDFIADILWGGPGVVKKMLLSDIKITSPYLYACFNIDIFGKIYKKCRMTKKDNLKAAIKKEMMQLIRKGELEFSWKKELYIVPKEHVNFLVESQSLDVLNLLYPKDKDFNVLEDEDLEECAEVSFGGVVNVPNIGYCTFNGCAEVSYMNREFDICIIMPVKLYIK